MSKIQLEKIRNPIFGTKRNLIEFTMHDFALFLIVDEKEYAINDETKNSLYEKS